MTLIIHHSKTNMKPDYDDSKKGQLYYTFVGVHFQVPAVSFRKRKVHVTLLVTLGLSFYLAIWAICVFSPWHGKQRGNGIKNSYLFGQVTATAMERRALAPVLRSRQLEQRKMRNLVMMSLKAPHYKVPKYI